MDYLATVIHIFFCFAACQLLSRPTNSETMLIQQAADLANHDDVMTLVITTVTTAFYRF
jgi:hypothetical protein